MLGKTAKELRVAARGVVTNTVGARVIALLKHSDAISRDDLIASFEADIRAAESNGNPDLDIAVALAREAIIAITRQSDPDRGP